MVGRPGWWSPTRDGSSSRHEVTVTRAVLDRLAPDAVDPVNLVRRSFVFLLEREPKESILRSFDLSVIGRYFPDYERDDHGITPRTAQHRRGRSVTLPTGKSKAPRRVAPEGNRMTESVTSLGVTEAPHRRGRPPEHRPADRRPDPDLGVLARPHRDRCGRHRRGPGARQVRQPCGTRHRGHGAGRRRDPRVRVLGRRPADGRDDQRLHRRVAGVGASRTSSFGALFDVVFLIGVGRPIRASRSPPSSAGRRLSSNLARGPFQGYVPEVVPAKQVGLASAHGRDVPDPRLRARRLSSRLRRPRPTDDGAPDHRARDRRARDDAERRPVGPARATGPRRARAGRGRRSPAERGGAPTSSPRGAPGCVVSRLFFLAGRHRGPRASSSSSSTRRARPA